MVQLQSILSDSHEKPLSRWYPAAQSFSSNANGTTSAEYPGTETRRVRDGAGNWNGGETHRTFEKTDAPPS